MPRGTNQKFKIYRLAQIMLEKTDDDHYITMPEIMSVLGEYGITADRKSIYNDLRDLEDLEWFEKYAAVLRPCPDCMIMAYIVAGAKDAKEIDLYQQFFGRAKMTEDQICDIYVENGMKTRISPDAMTIWHKEDTWRIKTLSKKGHVQLYHNNYVAGKNGVREFTQGFHVQNPACADTDMNYVLRIIKNYRYKPEEYTLHTSNAYSILKKKAKQKRVEKMEMTAVSLEEMLSSRSEQQTKWLKIKVFFKSLFGKKNFFELNGFELVSEQGYPKNQTICI